MLEIGEGLWYIITSGHKESQHFYNCYSIYFKSKTNIRNRKENKNLENPYLGHLPGLALCRPSTVGQASHPLPPARQAGSCVPAHARPTTPPPASPRLP